LSKAEPLTWTRNPLSQPLSGEALATTDEESEDEMMQREEEEKSGEGIGSEEKMDTEVGNLELAWQMFELAKIIFSKAGNLTKECESLTLLGEVSLENSNYKQAVEDLTTCLARRCAGMPADSRSIAETHFQLGVAQAHSGDYVSAEKSLRAHGQAQGGDCHREC